MTRVVADSQIVEWFDDEISIPTCRVCGCTENTSCPGGCWWVPDPLRLGDLCSACDPDDVGGRR